MKLEDVVRARSPKKALAYVSASIQTASVAIERAADHKTADKISDKARFQVRNDSQSYGALVRLASTHLKAADQKTEENTSLLPRLGAENADQNSGERHRRGEGKLEAEEAGYSKRENDVGNSPARILRNYLQKCVEEDPDPDDGDEETRQEDSEASGRVGKGKLQEGIGKGNLQITEVIANGDDAEWQIM